MLAADLLRLFAGVTILGFAAWTDWRWRRAPNVLWWILAGAGVVALGLDAAFEWERVRAGWPYLAAIPAFVAAMYGLWFFGLIAGGADAKALMAIAVLLPWPIAIGGLPLVGLPTPGAFATLGNSLLAFLVVPLGLLLVNAFRGAFRLPHAFLGLRIPLDRLAAARAWPMESVEDGKVVTRLFASRAPEAPPEEVAEALRAAGRTHVWISPKIPFMLPLLAGFVAAFLLGDLMTAGIGRALAP